MVKRLLTRPRQLGLAIAVVLAVAAWAWISVPGIYPVVSAPDETPEVMVARESSARQAIVTTRASVLAAVAGVGALLTIWINYRNSRVIQETFRVTERGHQTDRYTAAIEQLGNSESIAVRLGGIYALEQLARDSSRPGDQNTVVEVLSAFARIPRTAAAGGLGVTARQPDLPPLDVQAAVTVLGRLPFREGAPRADLRNVVLRQIDLAGLNFSDANLAGVDLTGARMLAAKFANADLRGATVRHAEMDDASFLVADLRFADFTESEMINVKADGANIDGAVLEGCELTQTSLSGARGLLAVALEEEQVLSMQAVPGKLVQQAIAAGAEFDAEPDTASTSPEPSGSEEM